MKEIKKILGLAANATEKQIQAAIGKLLKAIADLEVNLEAQTETSVKGSARINELESQLEETKSLATALDEENREIFKTNETLTLEVEKLKADGGNEESKNIQQGKDVDLEKAAKTFLKENKGLKEIFLTEDGQIFLRHSFANTHTKQMGGKAHNFKR